MKRNEELINFGLAVSALSLQPGEYRTLEQLAEFARAAGAHCTKQNLQHTEQKALRKLRVKLQFHKDPVIRELIATLTKR